MADQVQIFVAATHAFGERVRAIDEQHWSAPTPNFQWSVADLVDHLVDEHRWAAPLLHGHDFLSSGEVVEGTRKLPVDGGVGGNLAQSWEEAAAGSVDAVSEEGALERSVELSRGDTPVAVYLDEMIVDLVVHAWDLATAIGYRDPVPTELVDYAYSRLGGMGDLSSGGMFASPIDVADDASTLDKLLAATGRDPLG